MLAETDRAPEPGSPTLAEIKRALRPEAVAARARAHAALAPQAAEALAETGLRFLGEPAGRTVSGFMSFGEEIGVLPLVARLAKDGWRTAMPVIEGPRRPLAFRAWRPGEATVAGVWDIPRPADNAPLVEPDVLLVPLLAFDAEGYRLGYGGGFYDRTLARLRAMKPVVAVGVAYSAQEIARAPRGEFDQPVDWILTEQGSRRICG